MPKKCGRILYTISGKTYCVGEKISQKGKKTRSISKKTRNKILKSLKSRKNKK